HCRGYVFIRCSSERHTHFGGNFYTRRPASLADVAQLVAHHLAKVRVASSSLVIRSIFRRVISVMNDPPFSFRQYPAVNEASRALRVLCLISLSNVSEI